MNPFERHGITRLSPSTLNHFATEPARWVMARLLNMRAPASAAAVRGSAVERGVHLGLTNPDLPVEQCTAAAEAAFDREMVLNADDRRETERSNIAGYAQNALSELRPYGIPSAAQDRVQIWLEDVPLPIEGYTDWVFDDHGLIVDLKTTERLPSSISDTHGRQGAVYAKAHGNYGMRFAYVKPTAGNKDGRSVVVYELSADDVRRHLTAVRQIALRLGRFLSLSSDPHELAGLLVPDFEHFWWSHPIARSHGRNVYGF
jgi:PD-(D/E)XK nuclease superfamily